MVTFALARLLCPSVILYSKLSIPRYPAFGVYIIYLLSELTTDWPCTGCRAEIINSSSPSRSLSLSRTSNCMPVFIVVYPLSFIATGLKSSWIWVSSLSKDSFATMIASLLPFVFTSILLFPLLNSYSPETLPVT